MKRLAILLAVAAALAAAPFAYACFIHSPLPVELIEDHITITITDNIAVKQYTCTFYNPNPQAVVGGTCYMEFEAGAQIDKLTLKLDGKEVEAEMLDAEKAKKVFQEIVAKGGSTALLEFYGSGLIRAEVPKIPPQGTVTAVLRYTQIVKNDNGVYRMQFLNTNPKAWLKPLKKVTVNATMHSQKPIKSIYSPTHPVKVNRIDDHNATVSYEEDNYLPKTPMALYWHVAEGEVGVSALTYRDEDERGTFMMMVSPTIDPATIPVIPKEVVFCVDTSGSMADDNRIGQVRDALKYCIGKLRPEDRFNVVEFGTEARLFKEELLTASPENIERASTWVDKLKPRGRTAVEEAMTLALKLFTTDSNAKTLIFLADGNPNEGESDTDKLAAIVEKLNTRHARIFTFGIGNEINTRLLDMLAMDNGGTSSYVMPKENLTERVTEFYDRLANPVLTDISITFRDLKVEELYPKRLPDIFKGQQIVVFGRYPVDDAHWAPEHEVLVKGKLAGKDVSFPYTLQFPAQNPRNEFLPRVWAGRKVAHLMGEIKRNGQSKELVDEIVRLAKQYGIVTPYTSFLITDDFVPGAKGDVAMRRGVSERMEKDKAEAWGPPSAPAADSARNLAGAGGTDGVFEEAKRSTGRTDEQVMQRMRIIGSKNFYNTGGVWTDSVYDPEKQKDVKVMKAGSEEYIKLVGEKPGLAKYLSLGTVLVVYQGQAYRIEP